MPEETRQEQSEYSHHRRNFMNGGAPPLLLADVPSFDRSSGPMLSAETIDEFIQWAAGVPAGEVEVIRERIANAREDENLIDQLTKELWRLPVRDVSRHGLLLSTIGELRDPRAASVLIKFIWYDGEIAPGDDRKRFLHSCSFEADGSEVLRARATEMLSYLSSSEAAEATLEIVARHPSDFVRAAAIDAHMFNAGDSPEAAEQLHKTVREEDRWRVGLPRLTRDVDPEEFERAVLAFYEQYPQERPPAPEQHPQPGPETRSWYSAQHEKED